MDDQLQTLLAALPEKYDTLRETNFAQTIPPSLTYVLERMFDIEATQINGSLQVVILRGRGVLSVERWTWWIHSNIFSTASYSFLMTHTEECLVKTSIKPRK